MDDIARETLSGKVTFLLIASVKHFSFTVNDKVKKGYKRLWNYRKHITFYNLFYPATYHLRGHVRNSISGRIITFSTTFPVKHNS